MLRPATLQNSGKDLVFPRVAHHAHEGCGSLRRWGEQLSKSTNAGPRGKRSARTGVVRKGWWPRWYQNGQVYSKQMINFVHGWFKLVLGNLVSKQGSSYHNSWFLLLLTLTQDPAVKMPQRWLITNILKSEREIQISKLWVCFTLLSLSPVSCWIWIASCWLLNGSQGARLQCISRQGIDNKLHICSS